VGTLSGWILFAHQVGAALGAAAGGWIFEATGAYTWAFISAAGLAFLATGLSLAIRDEPIERTPAPRPARLEVPASATLPGRGTGASFTVPPGRPGARGQRGGPDGRSRR
jgi:MFS family permease